MAACLRFDPSTGAALLQPAIAPDQCADYLVLQRDEYQHYQSLYAASTGDFSVASGMAAFAFFFSTVLFFYQLSKAAGIILGRIKKAF